MFFTCMLYPRQALSLHQSQLHGPIVVHRTGIEWVCFRTKITAKHHRTWWASVWAYVTILEHVSVTRKEKKYTRRTQKQCYTKCIQKTWIKYISLCSFIKPFCCAQFFKTLHMHAIPHSSWASQSLANLICESMAFSHCNKSLWHATGYTSQQHLRASSIPPGMTWLLPSLDRTPAILNTQVRSFIRSRRTLHTWIINDSIL